MLGRTGLQLVAATEEKILVDGALGANCRQLERSALVGVESFSEGDNVCAIAAARRVGIGGSSEEDADSIACICTRLAHEVGPAVVMVDGSAAAKVNGHVPGHEAGEGACRHGVL
eukprot:6111533-Prymnesium_polylepis.1